MGDEIVFLNESPATPTIPTPPEPPEKLEKKPASTKKWKIIIAVLLVVLALGVYVSYSVKSLSTGFHQTLDDAVAKRTAENKEINRLAGVDAKMGPNFMTVQKVIEMYREREGSYKGFNTSYVVRSGFSDVSDDSECKNKIQIDISPDGKEYIIHYRACADPDISFCFKNGQEKLILADTWIAEKEYRCESSVAEKDRIAGLDNMMIANTVTVWRALEQHKKQQGSYKGFMTSSITSSDFKVAVGDKKCSNMIKTDIGQDGKSYLISYPLCYDHETTLCIENGRAAPKLVPISFLSKTHHCGL